jgi:hypothetical protein
MSGWETFALATGPAVVTAAAAYLATRQTIAADLAKFRAERIYDRLAGAYVTLLEAERERHLQAHRFTDAAFVDRWNDEKFRPAAAQAYLLGRRDVRESLDRLLASYNAEAVGEPFDLKRRNAEREDMLDAMRDHLREELGRR